MGRIKMLTPDRIKEKVFQTTGRGSYRSDDVDMFMSEVVASYEQMFKENSDLVKKITILAIIGNNSKYIMLFHVFGFFILNEKHEKAVEAYKCAYKNNSRYNIAKPMNSR
jgi:hypothetical protein